MHTKVKRFVLLIVALALLFGVAGQILPRLHAERVTYDLTNEPVKGLSPQLALATQALGWGRGIIIDVIWIRMEALKQEGRYFELVQLANWACDLAPTIPDVWDIQAWNMAYNVSCQIDNLPARWNWVWRAIELLRDKGIPDNPNAPRLYWSLAWTLFHKVGEQDDYAYPFYQQKLASLMQEVLGGGGDEETLKAMAAAPRTREELLKDPDVSRLVNECAADNFDIVDGFFETLYATPSVPAAVTELIGEPKNAAAMSKVATFARALKLREVYKMDPVLMLKLRDTYKDSRGNPAPFDWRSPYPHAIYWATVGLQKLDELEGRMQSAANKFGFKIPVKLTPGIGDEFKSESLYAFDRAQLERVITYSMVSLVNHGRVLFDLDGNIMLSSGPDYRFADATLPLYEKNYRSLDKRYASSVAEGYKNFLVNGVVQFYYNEDSVDAHRYYDMLVKKFPEVVSPYKGYDDFLADQVRLSRSKMTFASCRELVRAYIVDALLFASVGQNDDAAHLDKQAKDLAKNWEDNDKSNLRGFIDYDKIKEAVVVDALTGNGGYKLPPKQMQMLESYLGDAFVQKVRATVKAGEQAAPKKAQAPEKFQQNSDIKPLLNAPRTPGG
jgi:hypothetical protein